MVTQEQIDEQVSAVEVAESALDRAEAHHDQAGSEQAVSELRVARAEAHAARDKLRHLRSRYAAEQASSRARAAAEEAFPSRQREAFAQRLADARDEAAHAVAALDKAAAVALAAVAEYGVAVREASAELLGAGLRAGDGGVDGGTAAGAVHLGGEQWRMADPGSLVAAVMQAAVAAYDRQHVFAQVRWGQMGGMVEAQARAELLSRAAGR